MVTNAVNKTKRILKKKPLLKSPAKTLKVRSGSGFRRVKVTRKTPTKQSPAKRTTSRRHSSIKALSHFFSSPLFFIVLIIVGINLIVGGLGYFAYRQTVLSFKVSPTVIENAERPDLEPQHLTIADAQIDLAIQPALIKDGIWQISDNSASHLFSSARPTQGDNIVIYAHNKKNLFANLRQVKVGEVVKLTTQSGREYLYEVKETKVVKPSEIAEVLPTETEVLTLYTCTGLFDTQRLVVKASPIL